MFNLRKSGVVESLQIGLFLLLLIISVFLIPSCSNQQKPERPQPAKIENVSDTLHGVVVTDPYRWLENWDDPEVKSWSEGQNRYARDYLDNLPNVKKIRDRVTQIYHTSSISYYYLTWQGKKLFSMKAQPPLNHSMLIYLPSANKLDQETIIIDPNKLDPTGGMSILWYKPSPDGQLVAVCLTEGGSEIGNVHLFETETGKQVDEVIKNVNRGTAGGDLAWLPNGSGFYYTRYPIPDERPNEDLNFYQQIYYHRLGTSVENDEYVIGKNFPRISENRLRMDYQTGRMLLTQQYGDGGDFTFYLMNRLGNWQQIIPFGNQIVEGTFGSGNTLYFISKQNAPRGKIIQLSVTKPVLSRAKTVIPEGQDVITSTFSGKTKFVCTANRLYVTYQLGGPSELRAFDRNGKPVKSPEILPVSSVHELTPLDGDDLLFSNSSYIVPKIWYRFKAKEGKTEKTAMVNTSPVDYSDTEIRREFATSKDGTKIPVNIILKKDSKLDANNPTILYGYGGYGINISPYFSSLRRVWIEQGGIYAIANIRGGGEFGEEWHQAGMLTHKQNVFDDFAAAMQYLIDAGYTNKDKLAIMGGSNGGLLMGAMITQHPDLFKATVSTVGVYDMIRVELTPNGRFNIPEYGTVENPDQFKALYAYSPYHNVKDGIKYPAILFMTGANDPRVDPMHSRKMTARLQAATTSDEPILLRTSSRTGHGIGTPLNEKINQDVARYAFLFYELGVKYKPVK